ncbi:MAG: DinB family protein [Saprospiraceae bacterium]|nr:DinB family protein [Lewinella sp.]
MKIINDLQATRERTLAYFDLPEEHLNKTYGPGKWTIRQILNHLTDADTVLYERIRRGIANPAQVVWGFDPDRWAEHLDYKNFPLVINKAIYQAVRNGVIYLAERFYDSHGNNQYVHSETGLRTVKEEFDKVVWHNERHLQQIEQALRSNPTTFLKM